MAKVYTFLDKKNKQMKNQKKGETIMTLKKPKLSILTMGIVFIMFVSVAYAAYVSYNVTLPSFKGNVTLLQGTKSTNNYYVKHRNILIGPHTDGQAMNVWVEKYVNDDWVKISDTEVHYEGQGPYTLFTNPTNKGDLIRVRAENKSLSVYNYGAIGEIDLY